MSSVVSSLLRLAGPYVVAFVIGLVIAWQIQGLRLERANQAFTDYKQSIREEELHFKEAAQRQRDTDAIKFQEAKSELEKQIKAGDAYRRCVAAGKCGVREPVACSPSLRLPSASGVDAAGTDTVPVVGGSAAAGDEGAINDCALTTLMLNHLQTSIEAQPGY